MDILFMLGVAVALLMIVLGIYLFFFSRQSVDPAAQAALLEVPEPPVAGRPPVLPRAARGTHDSRTASYADENADAVSQYPTPVRDPVDHIEDDVVARITPQQARAQPAVSDAAVLATPSVATQPSLQTPMVVPTREFVIEPAEADSLDSMLDDLEQATAKLVTPIERGEVAEWQGNSALLDAHIEDQARRDDESPLAQAEQIVALYLLPTEGRHLDGTRVLSLLKQYGLRFGEMSLFHRFEESSGAGRLMFSVLRYTSEGPQGFDLESLPQEKIDGLAFFLALPNVEAVNGYDMMASISSLLARDFSAHLYDEEMNLFTKQLKAHYRHVVLEFKPKG
ncbi:MAG: cell division protein ZipA C-terminal FtsZ-binding domain-containing protein [Moraxellaceae bacterium]